MTKVEEAKAALWGQLVDSGELGEDDAEVLLDNLVDAAKSEGLNMALRWGWITSRDFEALMAAARSKGSGLPKSYGDALPIKDMPCGDSCLWGGA